MSLAGRGLSAAVLFVLLWGAPARAGGPLPGRQAVLFVLNGGSFEQLLAVPQFGQLARSGGAALMTTRVGTEPEASDPYRILATGTPERQAVPALQLALSARRVGMCENRVSFQGRVGPAGTHVLALPFTNGCPFVPGFGGGRSLAVLDIVVSRGGPAREPADATRPALVDAGFLVRSVIGALPPRRTLVMVVSAAPTRSMTRAGDEVTPVVMAEGMPRQLLAGNGSLEALSSDSTGQDGLVSNVDVAPTILRFFDVPIPAEMDGLPIGVVDASAPFALHRLHLEQRRIRLPVQFAELAFVVVAALLGTAALTWLGLGRGLPATAATGMRYVCVSASTLMIAVLAGGGLPHLTYPWVVSFVVGAMAVLTILAIRVGHRRGPFGPFAFLGMVGLGLLALDAALGGRLMRVPLFGGTMFDGVRFYGLPNAFIPLLLASALFVAFMLPPFRGFLVLLGAALFAGFPALGVNLGASITLFFAAGLWWVLRSRRPLGLGDLGTVAAITVLGAAATLLANRFLASAPTHVTRFARAGQGRTGRGLATIWDRLEVGFRMIAQVPAALLPLFGFALILWLVVRRVGPVGDGLRGHDGWRDLLITLVWASFVAYLANDTGAAAADPAFVYAMAGIVYPAVLVAARSRGSTPSPLPVEGART